MKTKLLTQGNSKLKKTDKLQNTKTLVFSLPAVKTCPMAGQCKSFCYATKGAYQYPVVKAKRERNLEASKKPDFVDSIILEITKNRPSHIRIHDSGDFYSMTYLRKWYSIATYCLSHNMGVTFYAYTKSISLIKQLKRDYPLPSNLRIIYSYGGKEDHLINPNKDAHSLVLADDTLIKPSLVAGYIMGNDNDHAILMGHNKIALLKH